MHRQISVLITVIFLAHFSSSPAQIVHRFDGDRFTHYRLDDWVSYGPALNITSIDIDESFVYFSTLGGGILRFDKYENRWEFPYTTSSGLRSNIVSRVVYDASDGFVYAESPAGIDVYKPAERFWRPASRGNMPNPRQPQLPVNSTLIPRNDFRFPPFSRPPNDQLPDFFTDIRLTYRLGGSLLDEYNREYILTDRVTDSWQRIWMGTDGFGPLMADLFHIWLESKAQSIPYIAPRDIALGEDEMWIAGIRNSSEIAGITYWNRHTDEWRYYEAPFIPQLYKDDVFVVTANDRFALFGTIHGLAVFDRQKEIWKTLSTQHGLEGNRVFDIQIDKNWAYVGTEFGFNWIDLKSMKVYELSETTLDNVQISQIAVDGDLIWAATHYGLFSINIEADEIEFYATQAGITDYDLQAVELIGDRLWVAGDGGIAYWDMKKDEWRSFPDLILQRSYSFQPEIRDIAGTRKAIWFATDKGLLKYDIERDYWRLFTEEDGLINDDTYHIDPEGNFLWISTEGGITRFRWKRKSRID